MRFFAAVSLLLAISGLCPSFASVSAANSTSEESCKDIQLPNVDKLNTCLGQPSASCDTSQDLIDDVGPLVKCAYEALTDLNKPGDALVAYTDVFYQLMNATKNFLAKSMATSFKNMVGMMKAGTVELTCSGGNTSVSLPSAVIGQCNSDLGSSCQDSPSSIVSPLVSLVKCLLENALPGASEDKTMALLCDLMAGTNMDALLRDMPLLWSAVFNSKAILCR